MSGRILNLGILAHVDAGKTTLTERLLYAAGVINTVGSVDRGSTHTDFLPLERQRGITIKSAVVSFAIGNITVNLIDTPGHPDFIAEVERVLSVLDGAVLVISAVEGVQPQTRVLMRTLQRLHIPTLIFINKIDRAGADQDRALRSISQRLTPAIVPMGWAAALGTPDARFEPYGDESEFTSRLAPVLAEHDDDLLAAYLQDEAALSCDCLRQELAEQSRRAEVHPVFLGSAITGAGVETLMGGIETLLPAAEGDAGASLSGTVFKVERSPAGEKIAYARIFSGTLHARDRLRFAPEREGKVTAIAVFERGESVQSQSVPAGHIAKLWGLNEVRIGDTIAEARSIVELGAMNRGTSGYFAPPTLETAVVPCRPAEKGALRMALGQLAEQDPLINLRQDDRRGEMYVSLYGEVQKEVIEATLGLEYDLAVHFRETSVICIERPLGTGEVVERLGKGENPFLATMGLRIEPAPEGSGIEFRMAVEVISIPMFIYKSTDEFQRVMGDTVRAVLQQGLCGWQVTDCVVTLVECGYVSPSSAARDFRLLTPLVLMAALQQAGTSVYEPVHRFHLGVPADAYGATAPVLARLGAVLTSSGMRETAYELEGEIRAAKVHELRQRVPAMTHGEGVLECDFDSYQAVSPPVPTRPRSDQNPLNRKEYLLHVLRHV